MFVTKWTADGAWVWTRIWGSASNDDSAGIVCDQAGDVYVAGTTPGSFGGQTNSRVGYNDFCLTKFSSSGSFQWCQIWGSTNTDTCNDIAKDPNADYIYLVGTTANGIFDGQTNFPPGKFDRLAITAYDVSSVTRRWSRVWGATNRNNSAMGVSASAWVYVTGSTFGSFDGEINYSPAYEDFFITQFDAYGTKNWTRIRGTNNIENAYGVAQVGGSAYIVGAAFANLDGQTRVGGSDFMIVKYDSSGNWLWTRLWGTDWADYPTDLALEGTNDIFACGAVYQKGFGGQTNPGSDSAVITRWRQGPNVKPSASITRPIAGREFLEFESMLCTGSGTDTDDGVLTNLVWQFGTNSTLSYGTTTTVSAAWFGSQTVTAYAVDTEFATGKASVVVTVLADGDNGLPQSWETNYWPDGNSGGDTNDFDGDGVNNRSEWESGTDPTNPLSTFKCGNAQALPGTPQITIQWPSVSNHDYSVSSSSNLPAGFSPLTSVPPTPPMNTYTTPASADPQTYYRVEVIR